MTSNTSILSFESVSCPLALSEPYNLSFGPLRQFDSNFIRIVTAQGSGYGEITPLPGYSAETPHTIETVLVGIADELASGEHVERIVSRLAADAPMVASALVCALETASIGIDEAFLRPHDAVALLALCQGPTPDAVAMEARRLSAAGYTTLKMKVGTRATADDVALLRAAASGARAGVRIRIDANQIMTVEAAHALVRCLADLPIELFEQPFPSEMDAEMAPLAAASPVPLMLDESINDAEDIDRAAALGVQYVKLKLCKHPGMAATRKLIARAQAKGLKLVFGNGVQSALGNRLEARVHREAGIASASEANGFLKVARSPFGEAMTAREGQLIDAGLGNPEAPFETGRRISHWRSPACSAHEHQL